MTNVIIIVTVTHAQWKAILKAQFFLFPINMQILLLTAFTVLTELESHNSWQREIFPTWEIAHIMFQEPHE